MKLIELALAIVLISGVNAYAAAEKSIPLISQAGAGKVTFLAVGRPSMLKIHGTAAAGPESSFQLESGQIKGSAQMDMDKLDTGIDLRTRHMKEKYLQVKDHPKATLKLLHAPVDSGFVTSLSNSGENPFKGTLSLHGLEKEVSGTFTAKDGLVQAKFPIKLSDFSIEVPTYLGITVADIVDVTVELPLKK